MTSNRQLIHLYMLQGIIELRIISDMLSWNVPDRASLQHNWIEYILKSLF